MRPSAPVVAVGGVLVRRGRALLVRRGKPPLLGRWSIPGGAVELGETLLEALVREMREETGLEVEPVEVLTVLDRIDREGEVVRYHFVIVDYLCRWVSGEPRAGSDAQALAWAARHELPAYELTAAAREVVESAFERAAQAAGGPGGGPGGLP